MNLAAEKPSAVFYDRRGNAVTPEAHSVVKPRSGGFAVAIAGRAIALVWPEFASDIPDLPGGGIDDGETPEEAIRREWGEETGLPFDLQGPVGAEFRHVRGFYAEDKNEFWVYDQIFRLYVHPGEVSVGTRWRNPEGDHASWESLDRLPELRVNRAHWCGIVPLLAQIDIRMTP